MRLIRLMIHWHSRSLLIIRSIKQPTIICRLFKFHMQKSPTITFTKVYFHQIAWKRKNFIRETCACNDSLAPKVLRFSCYFSGLFCKRALHSPPRKCSPWNCFYARGVRLRDTDWHSADFMSWTNRFSCGFSSLFEQKSQVPFCKRALFQTKVSFSVFCVGLFWKRDLNSLQIIAGFLNDQLISRTKRARFQTKKPGNLATCKKALHCLLKKDLVI